MTNYFSLGHFGHEIMTEMTEIENQSDEDQSGCNNSEWTSG